MLTRGSELRVIATHKLTLDRLDQLAVSRWAALYVLFLTTVQQQSTTFQVANAVPPAQFVQRIRRPRVI